MKRTVVHEPGRQGIVLRVQHNGHTLQTFLGREEYEHLGRVDFEYLKECNYALLENKIQEMS